MPQLQPSYLSMKSGAKDVPSVCGRLFALIGIRKMDWPKRRNGKDGNGRNTLIATAGTDGRTDGRVGRGARAQGQNHHIQYLPEKGPCPSARGSHEHEFKIAREQQQRASRLQTFFRELRCVISSLISLSQPKGIRLVFRFLVIQSHQDDKHEIPSEFCPIQI